MRKKILVLMMVCVMFVIGCVPQSDDNDKTKTYSLEWTFDSNGGVGTAEPVTGTITEYYHNYQLKSIVSTPSVFYLPLGTNFSKTGWTFCGWCKNSSGTGDLYLGGSDDVVINMENGKNVSVGPSLEEENLSVKWYAVWRQEHTITFDANGGTGSVDDIVYMLGVPDKDKQRSGVVYLGIDYYECINKNGFGEHEKWYLTQDISLSALNLQFNKGGNYCKSFNTRADGSGTKIDNGIYKWNRDILVGDITLYAIYE